ncbi:MAG: hypothetical protein Q9168_008138 [Polycauliona sp. 1 TL-2023]
MTITDMDKSHPLYTMDQNSASLFSSKPHMTITSSASGSAIGTATFHNWSRGIDLEIHGHALTFDSEGMFTRAYGYHSPAFGGEKLRWESDGFWGGDLVLVNGRKEWIARFDASMFSMSKTGKIQVVNGGIMGAALDEIIVTGCAMVEMQRRRRRSNAAGAGAAGGGGGGVANWCCGRTTKPLPNEETTTITTFQSQNDPTRFLLTAQKLPSLTLTAGLCKDDSILQTADTPYLNPIAITIPPPQSILQQTIMPLLQSILPILFTLIYFILLPLAIPFAILCTTIGLFGTWPNRISFLQNHNPPSQQPDTDTSTSTSTTQTSDSTPRNTNPKVPPSSPSPISAPTNPTPFTAHITPSQIRGTAFALALLRLWYSGELRALSQFMFTANLLVLLGYGGLWISVKYGRRIIKSVAL